MSLLDRIASAQGRNDEEPNFALARDLAAREDTDGIREIAEHLWDRDPNVRSDCIKVLYELGELKPALIAPYAADFLRLLRDKHNRMVWGGVIALSTIATVAADELYPHANEIQAAMARGSVIAVDNGVRALARLAATSPERNAALFPLLMAHLERCRSKEVPQHAEHASVAVTPENRAAFVALLERRLPELTPAQTTRLRRLLKKLQPGNS
jgi:hypothetical protein